MNNILNEYWCLNEENFNFLRSIDDVRLNDTLSIVQFIIHRMPIVTEKASNQEYRRLYPFTCKSREEFLSYNIGKQRAFEVIFQNIKKRILFHKHFF